MLFEASTTYAPGEPRGYGGYGDYQRTGPKGHYDLSILRSPNLVIGAAVLVGIAYWLHRRGGKR
jgi:hypothetical protein